MSGFQIPLELKIDFLENFVLPSFGVRPPHQNEDARDVWMRTTAGNNYDPHTARLFLAFNWIITFGDARTELDKLKQERREERQLQERRQENISSYAAVNSILEILVDQGKRVLEQGQRTFELIEGVKKKTPFVMEAG